MNNSVINNFGLNFQNQNDGYPRSLSQGRGPKPNGSSNTNTIPHSNDSSQVMKTEMPRVQAIAEAYNQVHQTSVVSMQQTSQQALNSWRSNQLNNQMQNSKGFVKHFQSTEAKQKFKAESSDASEIKTLKRAT